MVYEWELQKAKGWSTSTIKNYIFLASFGQPIPGNVSVEALRLELYHRGESPVGYHNT